MEVREARAGYVVTATPQVPEGYQQTEVGVIPEDWDVVTIADVADKITVGFVGSMAHLFMDNGIPLLRGQNVLQNKLDLTEMRFISAETHKRWKKSALQAGDVVMVRVGYPGTSCVISEELGDANAASLVVVRPARKKLSAQYFSLVINSDFGRRQIESYLVGGAQQVLNTKTAAIFKLPLPAKAEQEAIAEALSDADAFIESLERLLAKKRHLKQGAMQELLTGKRRLPGFSGEWEVKRLGELGSTFGGLTGKTKNDFGHGTARYITFMNIMTNVVIDCGTFESVDVKPVESQNRAAKGDLFFNGSSETPEEVGMCAVLMQEVQDVFLNSFCFGFRFRDGAPADGPYLAYYFRSREGRELLKSLAQGATRYNLSKMALLKVSFPLPSRPEQTAIATILSDMDAELAALEAKLAKARSLKQGMMQELLTGRIRLVQPASNVMPFPEKAQPTPANAGSHNKQINEAVIIGVLSKHFGTENYPLPRKRRVKLTYLLHRYTEGKAEGYLKKAAGPYDPGTKYKGPETIALKNGYVREHHNGSYPGFVASDKIVQAENYFEKWYGSDALAWLEQFKYKKTDELELLTTVDMAMVDLAAECRTINLLSVKAVIAGHPEWVPKLSREIFSDANIERAISVCKDLFG